MSTQIRPWRTRPISPTCEVLRAGVFLCKDEMPQDGMCGAATSFAYPAMGGGWMALCAEHGKKHLPHALTIDQLFAQGETWEGLE